MGRALIVSAGASSNEYISARLAELGYTRPTIIPSGAEARRRMLGAKKIVYHTCYHPGIYFLIGWAERMEEFFHEFLADRKDISIVLENVFDREWEPILEVKQRLPEPNFSLCLDIGHAHCMSPHPVEEWAQKLAGEITHLHIHDNHGERDEHLGLGKGTIQVREVLKNFQGREDCTYTIECNTKEDVRMSCRMLREIL